MVEIKTTSVTIGGRSYNKDKSGYPELPTVFSGVDITWGAGSCIEHPEASRAQLSLWVPKADATWIPTLGEVVEVRGGNVTAGVTADLSLFAGKVESVKVKDDHKGPAAPSRTNLITNPSFELGTVGWTTSGVTEAIGSYVQMAKSGSKQGQFTSNGTVAAPYARMDSIPVVAGEWFGAKAFLASEVAGDIRVRIAVQFKNISDGTISTPATTYARAPFYGGAWHELAVLAPAGTVKASLFLQFQNGAATGSSVASGKRLWAETVKAIKGPTQSDVQQQLAEEYFDGDTATQPNSYFKWTGTPHKSTSVRYDFTSTPPGYRVNIVAADALAEAARLRLSDTPWPFENVLDRQTRIASVATKAGVAFNAGLTVEQGYAESLETSVRARDIDSYPALEIFQKTTMAAGHTVVSVGNVVQPSNSLKLPKVLLLSGSVVTTSETSDVVGIDVSEIVDDTFELDTSRVINEIKIEMIRFIGSAGPPGWETGESVNVPTDQVFTDDSGSRKTTPQTRSISTDWTIRDAHTQDLLPLSVMVTKGRMLLAGQSKAQWRLSSALTTVLSKMPEQETLQNLLDEDSRFGGIIRVNNAPDLLPEHMRVRGGRIVLGDDPKLEFELEPLEYSAPIPLTRNTLNADTVAKVFTLSQYTVLTSNDLRSIGAR